jgi:prophage regulatory protein
MKILRLPTVLDRVGKSKASVYRDEAAGRFPKRIVLGANSVGWLESEIDAWIEARAAERDDTDADGNDADGDDDAEAA